MLNPTTHCGNQSFPQKWMYSIGWKLNKTIRKKIWSNNTFTLIKLWLVKNSGQVNAVQEIVSSFCSTGHSSSSIRLAIEAIVAIQTWAVTTWQKNMFASKGLSKKLAPTLKTCSFWNLSRGSPVVFDGPCNKMVRSSSLPISKQTTCHKQPPYIKPYINLTPLAAVRVQQKPL